MESEELLITRIHLKLVRLLFDFNYFLIRFLQCEKEYDSIFGIFYAIFTVLLIQDFFTNIKSKSCAAAVFDARTICAIEGGPQQSHRLLWDWIALVEYGDSYGFFSLFGSYLHKASLWRKCHGVGQEIGQYPLNACWIAVSQQKTTDYSMRILRS